MTLVIGLIWVSTIPSRFREMDTTKEDTPSALNDFMLETKENLGSVIDSVETEVQQEVFTDNLDALTISRDASATISDSFIKEDHTSTTPEVVPKAGPKTILIGTTTRQ